MQFGKREVSLIVFILSFVILANNVLATIIPTANYETLKSMYNSVYGWIDFLVYLVVFISIARIAFEKKLGAESPAVKPLYIAIGTALAIGLTSLTVSNGISLLNLGPVALIILVIALFSTGYSWFTKDKEKKKFSLGLWFILLLVFLALLFFYPDIFGNFIPGIAARDIWTLVIILLIIIGLVKLIAWIAGRDKSSKPRTGTEPPERREPKSKKEGPSLWRRLIDKIKNRSKGGSGKIKARILIIPTEKNYVQGKGETIRLVADLIKGDPAKTVFTWRVEDYHITNEHANEQRIEIDRFRLSGKYNRRTIKLWASNTETGDTYETSESIWVWEGLTLTTNLVILKPWLSKKLETKHEEVELELQAEVSEPKIIDKIIWSYKSGRVSTNLEHEATSSTVLGTLNKFSKRAVSKRFLTELVKIKFPEKSGVYTIFCFAVDSTNAILAVDVIYIQINPAGTSGPGGGGGSSGAGTTPTLTIKSPTGTVTAGAELDLEAEATPASSDYIYEWSVKKK